MLFAKLLLIGLAGGVTGGIFGFSTGAIVVPAMVMLLGLSPKLATGTYIAAQILPIGLLGANVYYRNHNLNITYALLIAAGTTIGNLLGSLFANQTFISDATVKQISGGFLIFLGLQYLEIGLLWDMMMAVPLMQLLWPQPRVGRQHSYSESMQEALSFFDSTNPDELYNGFIHQCEQELTELVGPVGPQIVQETVKNYPHISLRKLIRVLSTKISSSSAARKFQQKLLDKSLLVDLAIQINGKPQKV